MGYMIWHACVVICVVLSLVVNFNSNWTELL